MTPVERRPTTGYLYIIAASCLWAVAGVAVKFFFNTTSIDPLTLVQFRVTLATAVVGAALAARRPGLLRLERGDIRFFALYGTLGLASTQFFYYVAIRESGVAVAIFLQFLAPVFSALYEMVILGRRGGPATGPVLALSLGGALLLVLGRGEGVRTTPLGVVAGLAAALALAYYTVAGRRVLDRMSPWTLLFWGMAAASLFWAVIQPPWVALARPLGARDWGFFAYLAVFSTAIPFGLYLTGLRHVGPTTAILTGGLEPVWATGLAAIWLGEVPTAVQMVGCALILGAVVALQVVPGATLADRPSASPSARP